MSDLVPSRRVRMVESLRSLPAASLARLRAWRDLPRADLIATFAVIGVVMFNLWMLRAERFDIATPNDANVHASMVRWATEQFQRGHVPFDGWFPNSSLGAARFHQYQSLPHLIVAALQTLLGITRTGTGLVSWSLYLLLALWPIAVYTSARLFGIGHRQAAFAALLSPLLGGLSRRGFQWESYIFKGVGLWAQAWGMWLLPFAWATSWRAVSGKGSIPVAGIILGLTIPTHLLVGYLAVLSVPVFVLVQPREFRPRVVRAALVGVGALAASAWFLVPFLADRAYIPHAGIYEGKEQFDSFGWIGVAYMARGLVFDVVSRAPVVTAIVGWGLWRTVARVTQDETRRVVLSLFLLSLVLFVGKDALGPLVGLLPGGDDLFLNRYIFAVQMAGLYVAAIGAETFVFARVRDRRSSIPLNLDALAPVAMSLLVGFALLNPFGNRVELANENDALIRKEAREQGKLSDELQSLLDRASRTGRIYVGFPRSTLEAWGRPRDDAALVARFGNENVSYEISRRGRDVLGYPRPAWSLMSVQEGYFDDADTGHFRLFGAPYVLFSDDLAPKVGAMRLQVGGGFALWKINGDISYLRVVQTEGPAITADRNSIGTVGQAFLETSGPRDAVYRPIAFTGTPPFEPTGVDPSFDGDVQDVVASPDDGTFSGTVHASGPADVVLSASFDPRWTATVDGEPAPIEMVTPALPAVRVTAGVHEVRFTYIPVGGYWFRILVGTALLFGVRWVARRWFPITATADAEMPESAPAEEPVRAAGSGERSASARRKKGKRRR